MKATSMFKNKHSFFWKMVFTILLLLCLPLLLYSSYIINSSLKESFEQRNRTYREYAYDFQSFFHVQMNAMLSCVIDLSAHKTLTPEQVSRNHSYLWEEFSVLKSYSDKVPVVNDVYVWFRSEDYVLGSEHSYKYDLFANHFSKNAAVFSGKLNPVMRGEDVNSRFMPVMEPRDIACSGMLVFYNASVKSPDDTRVIYHINPLCLREAFYSHTGNDSSSLYIFDDEGNMLVSSEGTEDHLSEIDGFKDFITSENVFETNMGSPDGRLLMYRVFDSQIGVSFLVVVPEDVLMSVYGNRILYRLQFIAVVALSVLLLLIVVYINYRPIRQLQKLLPDDERTDKNEIDQIKLLINRTIQENESLTSMVTNMTDQLSGHILRELLDGRQATEDELKMAGLQNTYQSIFAAAVDNTEINADIQQEIRERITAEFECMVLVSANPLDQNLLFIFLLQECEMDTVIAITNKLKQILHEDLSLQNKIGIGKALSEISDLREVYVTAMIAYDQSEYGKVMYYEEAVRDFRHLAYYPSEEMMRFMRYVRDGDRASALSEWKLISDRLRSSQISTLLQQYICYDIINEFVGTMEKTGVPFKNKEHIAALMYSNSLEDMDSVMESTIDEVCVETEKLKLQHEKKIISEILQYINENLDNPDLCREMIVSRFGVSLNMISRLFQDTQGCGFREYVIAGRIEKAKGMLTETELSVQEIAARTGFRDTSYFIRTFKKVLGMTPNSYRKEYSGNNSRHA